VKRILRWTRPLGLIAVVAAAAVALFAAGSSGAAGGGKADLAVTMTSTPVTGTAVPYSTSAETAYVKYVIVVQNNSKATFTGVTMNDPATCGTGANGKFSCVPDSGWGGTIVSVNGPNCTLSTDSSTVSCAIGNMTALQTVTITLFASTPSAPPADCGTAATCHLINVAEASGDEQFNDKPASHVDTNSATSDLPLTNDTTAAFTSVTLPNTAADFFTDPTLGTTNVESTEASIPSNAANALVNLAETNTTASQCSAIRQAIGNTKLACLPQVATVSSTLSPYTGCATDQCLRMTFKVFGASIPDGFKLNKFQVVHTTADGSEIVPACPTVAASGDCLSASPAFDASGNLVWVATGPANGGWGGAG